MIIDAAFHIHAYAGSGTLGRPQTCSVAKHDGNNTQYIDSGIEWAAAMVIMLFVA